LYAYTFWCEKALLYIPGYGTNRLFIHAYSMHTHTCIEGAKQVQARQPSIHPIHAYSMHTHMCLEGVKQVQARQPSIHPIHAYSMHTHVS
jgi:uncharacterized Fe-S cluster protein YjdI